MHMIIIYNVHAYIYAMHNTQYSVSGVHTVRIHHKENHSSQVQNQEVWCYCCTQESGDLVNYCFILPDHIY